MARACALHGHEGVQPASIGEEREARVAIDVCAAETIELSPGDEAQIRHGRDGSARAPRRSRAARTRERRGRRTPRPRRRRAMWRPGRGAPLPRARRGTTMPRGRRQSAAATPTSSHMKGPWICRERSFRKLDECGSLSALSGDPRGARSPPLSSSPCPNACRQCSRKTNPWSVGDVHTSRIRPSGVEMYGASREEGIGSSSVGCAVPCSNRCASPGRSRPRPTHGRVERPEQEPPEIADDAAGVRRGCARIASRATRPRRR